MLFDAPISFDAALDSRAVKALLPTEASARELQRLPAELRERSVFSARTRYASHLAQIDRIVNQVLDPRFVYDPHTGGKRAAAAGESMSIPKARELLRASLDSLGYDPAGIDAVPGSLKDLRSFARLNLIIDTNVKMARGYGQWAQGQSAGILDEWPAQELYRLEARENERDWLARWRAAGGRSFGGRMIALKNDPIWTEISAFGLPYPPFDYNSGMDVRDIDRAEAMQLRLIDRDTEIAPASRGFNEDLQTKAPFDPALQPELAASIQQAMGDAVELKDGVLRFKSQPSLSGSMGGPTTLGLPDVKELFAARLPQYHTPEASLRILDKPRVFTTPAKHPVTIDESVLDDWMKKQKSEAEIRDRLRQMPMAVSTILEPLEIWEHRGQIAYYKKFAGKKNPKHFVVFVRGDTGQVITWHYRQLKHIPDIRRGDLLYALSE